MAARNNMSRWVGVFLIMGLALLVFSVILLTQWEHFRNARYPIELSFRNAAGVIKGSEVRIGGAVVGKVAGPPELKGDDGRVRVPIQLDQTVKIPRGAKFRIASLSLLGDRYIDISVPAFSDDADFIKRGEVIEGNDSQDLAALGENVTHLSESALETLGKVDKSLARLEMLVGEAEATARSFRVTADRVNEKLLSDKNLANLEVSLAEFSKLGKQMNESALKLDATLGEVNDAARKVGNVADSAGKFGEKVDPLMGDIAEMLDTWNKTGKEAGLALQQIRNPKSGSLFDDLMNNKKLAFDFRYFIENLSRQGILRYRDLRQEGSSAPKLNDARHQGKRF